MISNKALTVSINSLLVVLLLAVFAIEYKIEEQEILRDLEAASTYHQQRVSQERESFFDVEQKHNTMLAQYVSCDAAYLEKLNAMRFNVASITNVYVVTQQGAVCSEFAANQSLLSIDFSTSAFNIQRAENGILIIKTDAKRGIAMVWEISFREMWSPCDYPTSRNVILEYWLGNEFLVGIGERNYYLAPKNKTNFEQQTPPDGSVVSTTSTPLSLRLYFKRDPHVSLDNSAYIRIVLLNALAIIFWRFISNKVKSNLSYQIKSGVSNNEFVSHFQPIVDMRTEQWVGAEALIRWYRDGKIYKFPDEFIPHAEKENLSFYFTLICADHSKALLEQLPAHTDFFTSINISPNDLSNRLINKVLDKLNQDGRCKSEFEITERGIKESALESTYRFIKTLHQSGFNISLDDFGTGQSGLSYIKEMHFDKLKIDRTFVQAIGTDSIDALILTTIIELAKKLNVEVVAEGVETKEQVTWLQENGIYLAQGWYFERDLNAEEFIRRFNKQ